MNRKSPSKYTQNDYLNPFIPSREIPYDRNSSNVQIISPSNDIPIINEILEMNEQFCEVMKKRVTGLQDISSFYQENEYDDTIVQISLCKDLSIINDFFINAFLKKDLNKVHLKSDQVIRLFPLVLGLIKGKYDQYFRTGINTAWVFLKLYYDIIIQAKGCAFVSGVDLNREEKINKYNTIVDLFIELRKSKAVMSNITKKYSSKDLNFMQFIGEVDHFIKCAKN